METNSSETLARVLRRTTCERFSTSLSCLDTDNSRAYTTGFTDVQMEPAPFDPVLPTRWSPEEFTADLDDLLNFE